MKIDYKKQKYINNRFSFVSKDGVQHCSICNQPISEHYKDCSYIKAQSKKNRLIKLYRQMTEFRKMYLEKLSISDHLWVYLNADKDSIFVSQIFEIQKTLK